MTIKHIYCAALLAALSLGGVVPVSAATIYDRVAGRILLQVENHGEAWYVDPVSRTRYYLPDGAVAYVALRAFGLGITNTDLAKIPVGVESRFIDVDTDADGLADTLEEGLGTDPNDADTDGDAVLDGVEVLERNTNPNGSGVMSYDASLVKRLSGRIVLQVESRGEAWYINPADGKRYYLRNGEAAYQIMRYLSLGITNAHLTSIPSGSLSGTVVLPTPPVTTPTVPVAAPTSATLRPLHASSTELVPSSEASVTLFDVVLGGSKNSDTYVKGLRLALGATSTYPVDFVQQAQLFIDGKAYGTPRNLSDLSFTDFTHVIPKGNTARLELKGWAWRTSTTTTALHLQLTDVDAATVLGAPIDVLAPSGKIISTAHPIDSVIVYIQGNDGIAVQPTTYPSNNILTAASTAWQQVFTLRLNAQYEDLYLTDLFIKNTDLLGATSLTADSRIQSIGLFDSTGVLKQAKSMSNGRVHFSIANGPIKIPRNGSVTVGVRVVLNPITDASQTGSLLRLAVDTSNPESNSGVIVRSSATGGNLTGGNIAVTTDPAPIFVIRQARPVINAVVAGQSTMLTNGSDKAVYRFTVGAQGSDDISWRGIKFDLRGRFSGTALTASTTAQGGGLSTLTSGTPNIAPAQVHTVELYEVGTNRKVANGNYDVIYDWDGADDNGEVAVIIRDGLEEIIAANTQKTYELRATINGVASAGDYLDVSLDTEADEANNDARYIVTADPEEVSGAADGSGVGMTATAVPYPYTFLWSDYAGTPHSASDDSDGVKQRDWTNDRLIRIDSVSFTLTR